MKIGIDWGGTKIEGIVLDPQTKIEIIRILRFTKMMFK